MAEMVVLFDPKLADKLEFMHMRAGQLMSKARFFSSQFLAYFEDDLWLKNAKHSNLMAQTLSQVFYARGFQIIYPVDANEVFVAMPEALAKNLWEKGAGFYPWDPGIYRFVTSFSTTETDIQNLLSALQNEEL